jgi:ethanolaminephosphotransferase
LADLSPIFLKMISRTTICLVAANILIPIAILTFASGFFPYKPFLAGLSKYEALEYGPPPEAPFDRVVFMVVDALRRWETCPVELLEN